MILKNIFFITLIFSVLSLASCKKNRRDKSTKENHKEVTEEVLEDTITIVHDTKKENRIEAHASNRSTKQADDKDEEHNSKR